MQRRVLSQKSLWDNQWRHWPQWRRGRVWHYYKNKGKVLWFATEHAALLHIERKASNG